MVVTGNWSGTFGNTGASNSGSNKIECASNPSDNQNSFAAMPQLIAGHTYLLLVSHFTDSQSGYDLSFGGGTAVITDPKMPHLQAADANCGGDIIRVKLNKHVKCSSIEMKGSDFVISPGGVTISSAMGIGCDAGFDTDSIVLQLSGYLNPGTYTLQVKNGTDGNTLLDNCDNAVPQTDQVNLTVYPKIPTPMDSLSSVTCAPGELHLIFRKPMNCSSIALDGSDFTINGSYPVSISGARANGCSGDPLVSREIIVILSQPLQNTGNFVLTLKTGTDGNTIIDECGSETPGGASLSFAVKDTVNADFTYKLVYGCNIDTVNYFHPGTNGVNSWKWNLDENKFSIIQNPSAYYQIFNTKNTSLIVSNGFCSDTAYRQVNLDNYMKAGFSVLDDNCPNEPVNFKANVTGNYIKDYTWSFGDGFSSVDQSPTHIYGIPTRNTGYIVSLTLTDDFGCQTMASKKITVYSSCYLAVPNAFTPNGDGKNDLLHPLNAVKAENLDFKVYNRWGQLVFETKNWKQGWDGTCNGQPQQTGVYVWFLKYTDRDTHQVREMKGTAALIR
jgi:gliding motility-associated-like protein